jgi:hypothetical protein
MFFCGMGKDQGGFGEGLITSAKAITMDFWPAKHVMASQLSPQGLVWRSSELSHAIFPTIL